MKRNNNDLLRDKLREMWRLLQPKQSEPCEVFKIGDMVICKSLLSDSQLREGQNILDDCMSPVSGKIEDFVDAILRRLKYMLLEKDAYIRKTQHLHRQIYRYRKMLGDDEDSNAGDDHPNSDRD